VPRREFRAYITRIFLDNELRVPIHYDAYMWPETAGQTPPLEESYTYRNMKINTDLTANDFDPKNPEIFRP
jgi:outer membrane lipoprotein-sorting protein